MFYFLRLSRAVTPRISLLAALKEICLRARLYSARMHCEHARLKIPVTTLGGRITREVTVQTCLYLDCIKYPEDKEYIFNFFNSLLNFSLSNLLIFANLIRYLYHFTSGNTTPPRTQIVIMPTEHVICSTNSRIKKMKKDNICDLNFF